MKVVLIVIACFMFLIGVQGQNVKTDNEIVFQGKVLAFSPGPFIVSGDIPSYGLVKYKVIKVCSGKYDEDEIVVDHLILSGKELSKIKKGNLFKVVVRKAATINQRTNVPSIREVTDTIEAFFIASRVSKASPACDKL